MNIVAKLKKKYSKRLKSAQCPRTLDDFNPTIYLFQKWAYKVEKKYYGFDLNEAPFIWSQIIDEFLEQVEKYCPDFKIL